MSDVCVVQDVTRHRSVRDAPCSSLLIIYVKLFHINVSSNEVRGVGYRQGVKAPDFGVTLALPNRGFGAPFLFIKHFLGYQVVGCQGLLVAPHLLVVPRMPVAQQL